jgi:cell division septation protein DedD
VFTNENSFAEILPYFEVGMTFEVTPRVFPNRHVAISSASVVQVRRGPAPQGGLAPLAFETKPIRHDIQIPAGKTILLGGFLTASNSSGLPRIPVTPGNPVLGYVGTQSPRKGDAPEIIVLLSPRVIGMVEPIAPPAVSIVPAVKESSREPEVRTEPPVLPISTSNAHPKPEISIPVSVPKPAPAPAASVPPVPVPRTPAPDAPVRKASPASKKTARFFTVQVGAFSSSVKAESLATELKKKFQGVFVDQAPVGTTPYRVRVGRLSTLAAAKRVRSRLQALGFESFVVTPEML